MNLEFHLFYNWILSLQPRQPTSYYSPQSSLPQWKSTHSRKMTYARSLVDKIRLFHGGRSMNKWFLDKAEKQRLKVNPHFTKLTVCFLALQPTGKCWGRSPQPGAKLPGFKSRFWYLLAIGAGLVYLSVPQFSHQSNRRVRISSLHEFFICGGLMSKASTCF